MLPTIPCRLATLALLCCSSMPISLAFGRDSLTLSADTPTVNVAPRDAGRSFLRLPALEYSFELLAMCTDGRHPEVVSLSVADTRRSLTGEELQNGSTVTISLKIPPAQIAPLPVADFCVIEAQNEDSAARRPDVQLTIPSALSAQISLLCKGEDDQAMTYVSKALDVLLTCETPPTESDGDRERISGENP